MRSMNPDAPNFVDASAAAARYANFVNEPKYVAANNYFDTLKKEKLANQLKEEEFRRYNQEFGLKQAAANREQSKYDRELNTDKALLDYQNIIRGTSQGGIINNNEGMSLANEYQKLVGTVGEEKAAETINAKAQMLAQRDATKAQSDPFYAANKVQGLTINDNRYGSIDPTKLINMQTGIVNDFVDRGESLRTFNADQAYKNNSLALDREKMGLQKAQYDLQNKRYDTERENKLNEQMLKEQAKITKLQQFIALGYNPNNYTNEQIDGILKSVPADKKFVTKESTDPTTGEVKTKWIVENKEKTDQDKAKENEEILNAYTKLVSDKKYSDLISSDSDASKLLDIARQAKIKPNIIENILANKNAENSASWFNGDLTHTDFNKFKVQDPNNKEKWTSLGDLLKAMQDNPNYFEQVVSGQSSLNLIEMTPQELQKEADKQKKEDDNFNPYRIR